MNENEITRKIVLRLPLYLETIRIHLHKLFKLLIPFDEKCQRITKKNYIRGINEDNTFHNLGLNIISTDRLKFPSSYKVQPTENVTLENELTLTLQ